MLRNYLGSCGSAECPLFDNFTTIGSKPWARTAVSRQVEVDSSLDVDGSDGQPIPGYYPY
jgi:hypothetical protein